MRGEVQVACDEHQQTLTPLAARERQHKCQRVGPRAPNIDSLLSFVDALTGAYNRRYFRLRLDVDNLKSAQSRGFTVIARLGGDEFGAVLPQTPKAGALQYAERIRRLIEAYPFRHSPVTVSVGVAAVPDDLDGKAATPPEALIQAADGALYEAKRLGRNRVASLTPASPATS